VATYRGEFGVARLCRVVNLPVSTFYDRVSPPVSARAGVDAELTDRIEKIWVDSGRTYGAPRIHAALTRDGIRVGRKRVERLMAGRGWSGAYLRRGWALDSLRLMSNRHLARVFHAGWCDMGRKWGEVPAA